MTSTYPPAAVRRLAGLGARPQSEPQEIQSKKEALVALESALKKRVGELRELCLKEGELTGQLPSDYPLQPREPIPQVRRRHQSNHCSSSSSSSSSSNSLQQPPSIIRTILPRDYTHMAAPQPQSQPFQPAPQPPPPPPPRSNSHDYKHSAGHARPHRAEFIHPKYIPVPPPRPTSTNSTSSSISTASSNTRSNSSVPLSNSSMGGQLANSACSLALKSSQSQNTTTTTTNGKLLYSNENFLPFYEETKPFQMSDFYKYSSKHRQKVVDYQKTTRQLQEEAARKGVPNDDSIQASVKLIEKSGQKLIEVTARAIASNPSLAEKINSILPSSDRCRQN